MVSIPDWAKFAQMVGPKHRDTNTLLNKFYKQREAEAVKHAEESGYFLNPTEYALHLHCEVLNESPKEVAEFKLIILTGLHLRMLGDIGMCTKLTICLLANNFLTRIDALVTCRHLIKLDLHSNQLTSIPDSTFWSSLRKLQALHLHDNPLGKFETLQILGSSPILSILTLYDTPLSLKKNYRHHVVNSIWTLKALDRYVISDEEIIEDAVFSTHFSALSQPFRIELCPPTLSTMTYVQQQSVLRSVHARINNILARHSPVLIVQRSLRGYQQRRKMGIVKRQSITRLTFPPPGTSIIIGDQVRTTIAGEAVDYDTYMRNRRPGSILPDEDLIRGIEEAQEQPSFRVNLEKLELGTLSGLNANTVTMEKVMASTEARGLVSSGKREKGRGREKQKREQWSQKPRPRKAKDIKHLFRPVVNTSPLVDNEAEDQIQMTDFRIKGSKPKLLVADATTEMILARREAGKMVRDAEKERMKQEMSQSAPKATSPLNFRTIEQRLFNRTQGTMGLSCLLAVHKAYREREKAEKSAAKMENVLGMREERERAKDRINMYHDERRAQVLKSRHMDHARIIDQMEKHELKRLNFLDKHQDFKVRSSEGNKDLRAEHSFMVEFNSQHTSVSNALLRHDKQAKTDDVQTHKHGMVSNAKTNEVEQQDVVKKYMEHRQMMRQTETAMAKAALDTKMLSEANERIMDARNRVAHLKARRASIQAIYRLPPNTMPPTSTAPSTVSGGRVDRHKTVLT